VMWQIF